MRVIMTLILTLHLSLCYREVKGKQPMNDLHLFTHRFLHWPAAVHGVPTSSKGWQSFSVGKNPGSQVHCAVRQLAFQTHCSRKIRAL